MASNRTRNQALILKTLQSLNREIAAQELYIYLHENNQKVGLATVYRSLEVLKQQGALQVRTLESGISLYSSLQRDRHHLNCVKCGKAQVMDECPLRDLEHHLGATANFKVFYHTLAFYGLCSACQEADSAETFSAMDSNGNNAGYNNGASTVSETSSPHSPSSQNCC